MNPSVVIDKIINPDNNPFIRSGFKQNDAYFSYVLFKRYINVKNIFPVVVIIVFLRIFGLSREMIVVSFIILLILNIYRNKMKYDEKMSVLCETIFNGNEQPFNNECYLEMDNDIIDFYYNNRWYIDYNLTAYRKSLEAVNNILRYEYNIDENLMLNPEQLYENAYIEYKEALNNLHSSIYKMTSHMVNNDVFNNNLSILNTLLKKHIDYMKKKIIKTGYNMYDITRWSIINPNELDTYNDIKSKGYSQHYSFF